MSQYTNSSVRQSQLAFRLNSTKQVHMAVPTLVSDADIIEYNVDYKSVYNVEHDLTNGTCSTDINFNTTEKGTVVTTEKIGLKGSERFNKYKTVNNRNLLLKKNEACQNNCSSDERHSFNKSSEIRQRNINNNNNIVDRDVDRSSLRQSFTSIKKDQLSKANFIDKKISTVNEKRRILREISENSESEDIKIDCYVEGSFYIQHNLDRSDKTIDKTIKSEINTYGKVQVEIADTEKYSDKVETNLSSYVKTYASAIPQPKRTIPTIKGACDSRDLKNTNKASNNGDPALNKYSRNKTSQPENKLSTKTEVQETRPNVISSQLCIPVHNHTGKKYEGLNVIDIISITDKTIPFNKGDVQNQRCGTINKYCRNTRVNEPVTGRLGKIERPRTPAIKLTEDGDLANSCTAGNIFLTTGYGGTKSNIYNEDRKKNADITCGDFNYDNGKSEEKCDNYKVDKRLKQEGRTRLKFNSKYKDSSKKSPVGCQYKFNDFTCEEYRLNNDKSDKKKYTSDIKNDKTDTISNEVKHILQLESKDILKTNEICESPIDLKLNSADASSNFMKFQITGSDGIMDKSLPSQNSKHSTIKPGAIKRTLRKDNVEKILVIEQVKTTGNVLKSAKTTISTQRLKSNSTKSDITPQGKFTPAIKKEYQVKAGLKRGVQLENTRKLNERKNGASRTRPVINDRVLLTDDRSNHITKTIIQKETKAKAEVFQRVSKCNKVDLIRRNNDNNLSNNKAINNVCHSLPTGLIDCDNRQSSDKEITDEVNETCIAAKDTSIDYRDACFEDIETFTENKSSKDDYVGPGLISPSNVHNNKQIEALEQLCVSGKAHLRCKECILSDRLHNIRATGNNNSEEIDHLADGQDGKADDHKVQQTAGEQLSYLLNSNRKSEKDIRQDAGDGESSQNICFCALENCQKITVGNLSFVENGTGTESRPKIHISSTIKNEQHSDGKKCGVSSSSVTSSDVPETIINNNCIMGNDLQYMTTARNTCRGISVNIEDTSDLHVHDLPSVSQIKDSNDSFNLDDFVNNGITKSTTSTDGGNYDISLPLTLSTDNNLRHAVTDTLLCNVNNTKIMDKQRTDKIIDTAFEEAEKTCEHIGLTTEKESKIVTDKPTLSQNTKKLISPKISTKKFNKIGKVNLIKSKCSTESDKRDKEKQNLENSKLKDRHRLPYDKSSSTSSFQTKASDGNHKLSESATRDIRIKESSPCSDVLDISSNESDTGLRSTKPKSVIRRKAYEQSDKTMKTLARQKVKDTSDATVKKPGDGCQSIKSDKTISSAKITHSKYTSPCKQLTKYKKSTMECPSSEIKQNEDVPNVENKVSKRAPSSPKNEMSSNFTSKNTSGKSSIPIKPESKTSIAKSSIIKKPNKSGSLIIETNTNSATTKCNGSTNRLSDESSSTSTTTPRGPIKGTSKKQLELRLAKTRAMSESPSSVSSRSSRASSIVSPTSERQATFVSLETSSTKIIEDISKSSKIKDKEIKRQMLSPIKNKIISDHLHQSGNLKVTKNIDKRKKTTPSPTLSRSSRASSVTSVSSMKTSSISKSGKKEHLRNTCRRSSTSSTESDVSKSHIPRVMKATDFNKRQISLDKNSAKLVNSNCKRISKLPRTKLPMTNINKPATQPKAMSTLEKRIPFISKVTGQETDKLVQHVQCAVITERSMNPFIEEHPICKTSDINDEKLKTVCISDKPDRVSTADQIRQEPFDFCEAQKTNIITNQHLQKQVQDPLIEIVSEPNSKTIALMDNIQNKLDVHSSIESVCSEQYWSASEGEHVTMLDSTDEINFEEINAVNESNTIMDNCNVTCVTSKDFSLDQCEKLCKENCIATDDNTLKILGEKSHVPLEADDCSLNAMQLECKSDLLHNYIDTECTTENISENCILDITSKNISQHSEHDSDTSERLINTFLRLDSKDFDKAQCVSTDYKENITLQSNLEHYFYAGNDNSGIEINEVNHRKSQAEDNSSDTAENAVNEIYVKKLSETNIMEHLINQSVSSDTEHLERKDSCALLTSSIVKDTYNCEEGLEQQSQGQRSGETDISERRKEQFIPIDCFEDVTKLETYKGDFCKFGTETREVKTSSIQGNGQLETIVHHQNEEVIRARNELICENDTNTFSDDNISDNVKCLESQNDNSYIENNESAENENLHFGPLESKYYVTSPKKSDLSAEFEGASDSDFSDSNNMASSSVQNSPSTRRPRRVFSQAERKQKYEQISIKGPSIKSSIHYRNNTNTKTEISQKQTNDNNETVWSQQPEIAGYSSDDKRQDIPGKYDITSSNSNSRCKESSLINASTVQIKHNMDDRSNKHAEQKLYEEETLTKIITNEHDITLSHSQSKDLELILSDETPLSSAKHSGNLEEDAAQGVVKRTITTSAVSENRRAINLDKYFHSEDRCSISVECTLELNSFECSTKGEENKTEVGNAVTINQSECQYVDTTTINQSECQYVDITTEETLVLYDEGIVKDTVSKEHELNTYLEINYSASTWHYLNSAMPSNLSDKDQSDINNSSLNKTSDNKPETLYATLTSSDNNHNDLPVCKQEIMKTDNDVGKRLLNSQNCEDQLERNKVSDNILHSFNDEQLNTSNSAIAQVHENTVICPENITIPYTENHDKSKMLDEETSENHDENKRGHADRKHMTLNLSACEKYNNDMGMTVNAKVTQKNKNRQSIRRLTDTIMFDRNEDGDTGNPIPLKPRARSKSPQGSVFSPTTDNDQGQGILGFGKVSQICRTFIQKTCKEQLPISPTEVGNVKSKSPSRPMKWARVEGVWQRVPVDDDNINSYDVTPRDNNQRTLKPNRKSNETLSQWKNLVDKIQKIQKERHDTEDNIENPTELQTDSLDSKNENADTMSAAKVITHSSSNAALTMKTKPKPPKILPKPKRPSKPEFTDASALSIMRSTGDNDLTNVSSKTDNESQEMQQIQTNSERQEENNSKQVQEGVKHNKIETEIIGTHNNTFANEHEKSIIMNVENSHLEKNFKSKSISHDISKMNVVGENDEKTNNISNKKEVKEYTNSERKVDIKTVYTNIRNHEAPLGTYCDNNNDKAPLDLLDTPNQVSSNNLDEESKGNRNQQDHVCSKDKKTNDKSSCNQNNGNNIKSKTVPIKQEMFPKEEYDISSDIIAKVLKVMDSFTNADTEGVNCNKDLCDERYSRKDYTNSNKDQQDNHTTGKMGLGQRQQKLLSEISELEERSNDAILEDRNKNITNQKGVTSPCVQNNNRSPCLQRSSFSRSHSLPTTALSHPGSRILYRDGSFVIEPDFPEKIDESVETRSLDIENGNIDDCDLIGKASKQSNINYSRCRRSQSEADLCDVGSEENLFLQNDGNLTVIENESYKEDLEIVLHRTTAESSSHNSSVEENELVGRGIDSKRKLRLKKKSKVSARRSKSFRDFSETEKPIVKLRRNLSFVEAVNDKEQLNVCNRNGSIQSLNSTVSIDESPHHDRKLSLDDTKSKGPGFLQKVFSRRKGVDQGGKKKSSDSKESILRKMSLKTIFGGKKSKERSPEKESFVQTPPIAAFQSDNDIHMMDSAPGSPYSSQRFKRRHTSAEIYDQSGSSSARSSLDILHNKSQPCRLEDQLSIKSFNSSTLSISEQPLRPKSPKPNVMIIRRNSNLSLPNSPVGEVVFDMGGKPIDVTNRKCDSVDAGKLVSPKGHPCDVPNRKPSKQMSGVDLEKLASLVQNDMTSSNSNDSGIQHDVSVHSSNESLKVNGDNSNVARRRKSPSPRPERPKSEISVRWADLVENTEISPVKRREGGESKPRPKSDLGGSSLGPDMKPFGSQSSLQLMYSSLQSLDSLRKHDSLEQKPSKRRMSTPHPIKTRLSSRVPPKQQRRVSLVRSHSMPESLDKLHRRRKLHSAIGSSNLHDFYLRNFEDDSSSDDGSDISVDHISLNEKSMSARSSRAQLSTLDEMPESENRTYAEALWDHITMDPEELRFRAGDLIEVIDMNDKDWWYGSLDDHQEGWLPATFVRLRVNQEHFQDDFISHFSEIPEHSSPNLRRISMINTDQGRTNVINEILQAEQDYVKHMKDVVEGYIRHARKRVDMFTEEKISVIFGNIEEIFKFSTQFLETLESAYCKEQPHQSDLGKCFLKHRKGFEIYSDYCNNHPSGSAELKELYRKQKYRHFFEACRLLQEMIEIPLEGFLLNPVQKICKYPLQLAELLKYTPPSHPDYDGVKQAWEAMKKIAALINERKRKMESIEKLARWQHTVEDWQGMDLLEKSSELIYSSEINKINSAGWSQERWFYLFDHQLVYCKKDLLKRNGFSYKGRIDMDECDIINIEDGKDVQYNVTVKNAWKLHEKHKDKWYLLYAKTQAEKQRWLKAFQKERERVREDQENNFIPDHWKKTILNRIKSSQDKQNSRTVSDIQYKQEFIRGIPSHATLPRSYSKKQTKKKGWFPFGGKQKSKS